MDVLLLSKLFKIARLVKMHDRLFFVNDVNLCHLYIYFCLSVYFSDPINSSGR